MWGTIKRKITSTRPTYANTSLVDCWWCPLYAKHNFVPSLRCCHTSLHVPCVRLIGCHFWDGALVFQRSEHFTTSKPPTNILWFSTFYTPNFFCGVTQVLSNFESHNRTSALLPSMTCVLWGILSHVTTHRHYLQAPLSTLGLRPGFGTNQKLAIAVTSRNPTDSCQARFPWKMIRTPRAVGCITFEFTVRYPRHILREKAMESQGFLRGVFSFNTPTAMTWWIVFCKLDLYWWNMSTFVWEINVKHC